MTSSNTTLLGAVAGLAVTLAGCGGGGSSGSTDTLSLPPSAAEPESAGAGTAAAEAYPDFEVRSLVATTAALGTSIVASATIANVGDVAADVPPAWLMVSTDAGFATDYHHVQVELMPRTADAAVLEPGESAEYTVGQVGFERVSMGLDRYGTHYARLWVNPDLSARLLNTTDRVEPEHAERETDYTNNLSELAAFEQPVPTHLVDPVGCAPDQYEQNDSLEEATRAAIDTIYEINGCDETFDVFAVELAAGQSYRIRAIGAPRQVTVLDPTGLYLLRRAAVGLIVTAERSGTHHVALAWSGISVDNRTVTLEIISL